MRTDFFEEMIEFKGIVGVEVIHYCHRVPFHSVLFQQVDALHHFDKGWSSKPVFAVFVMKLLRPVDRYAHQPIVLFEELAPFVGEQCAVGLYAVVNRPSVGVFLLQFHRFFVEGQRAHQGFSAVPGEQYLRHCLRIDIFFNELLQQFIAHHVFWIVYIQFGLLQIITIIACQVAYSPYGLEHYIKRFGKRSIG